MSYGYDGGEGPRPAINLRLIGGLLIALVSVVIYMTRTQVNPVTGEKQHIAISTNDEMALGLQAAPQMAAQMGGDVGPNDPEGRVVQEVGRKLVRESDAKRSPYVENYSFHLLNDRETVNAFALPGGPVFITRALYDKLDTEAELAGVLGHEIGHVVNRHSAQQMAKGQLGQMLTLATGVGASGGDDGGRKAAAMAAMVNQLTQLKFSREDESEADKYGLKYMAEAGYDPGEMLRVMEVLRDVSKNGGREPEFLATHPLPETRLDAIRAQIKADFPDGVPASLSKGRPLHGASVGRRDGAAPALAVIP